MRHTEFSTDRPHKRLASEPPERAHVMCSGASHGKTEEEEKKIIIVVIIIGYLIILIFLLGLIYYDYTNHLVDLLLTA